MPNTAKQERNEDAKLKENRRYFLVAYVHEKGFGNSFWTGQFPNNKDVLKFLTKEQGFGNAVIINILEMSKEDYDQFRQ